VALVVCRAFALVASGLLVLPAHQTENAIQAIRAMLKTKAAVLTTSLLNARLGLNAMRCFGDSFDDRV
jgi:hypothetical protein